MEAERNQFCVCRDEYSGASCAWLESDQIAVSKVVSKTVDELAETVGDQEIILSAVSAITTDPDLLTPSTSYKAIKIILKNSMNHLRHTSAKQGMDSLSNIVAAFKIHEMTKGEKLSNQKSSYLATMEAARSVLDAVSSCDKPFNADTDIISAVKHSFDGGEVSAGDGTSFSFAQTNGNAVDGICANIASFSVNTYSWISDVSMASGTTSINLSTNGKKDEVQPDRPLLISIKIDPSNDGISDLDLDCSF